MENLNAEQIIKAMECCIKAECWGDCQELGCPASTKNGCHFYLRTDDDNDNVLYIEMLKDALALINSQEQRIKELTEENERLEQHRKILEARNERLEIICDSYALQYGTVADKEVFLKEERADTVRKMQELIKERCIKGGIYPAFVARTIDQIAKEMLEGTNE